VAARTTLRLERRTKIVLTSLDDIAVDELPKVACAAAGMTTLKTMAAPWRDEILLGVSPWMASSR